MTLENGNRYGRIVGTFVDVRQHSSKNDHAVIEIATTKGSIYQADFNIGQTRASDDLFYVLKQLVDPISVVKSYPIGIDYKATLICSRDFKSDTFEFKPYTAKKIRKLVSKYARNANMIIAYGQLWTNHINESVIQGIRDLHINSTDYLCVNDGAIGFYDSATFTITWVFCIFKSNV